MNKNYDWNETNTGVTIIFPLLYKIDKKKFDYTLADSYIKLNLYQMKQLHFIDLMGEINVDESKIVFEENKIIFNLAKKENGLWKKLESNLPKDELKERRKKANERLEEAIKQKRELAETKKKEFEKFVVEQSIKIDDNRREEIRTKKEEEKTAAEKDLYKFVDKMDKGKIDEEVDEDDENVKKNDKNDENVNINQKVEEETKINEENENDNKNNDNTNDNNNNNEKNEVKHKLEEDPYKNEEEIFKREEVKDPTPIKHSIESRRNQIFFDEEKNKNKNEMKEKPIVIQSPMVAQNNFQNTLKALINKEEKSKEPPKPQPTNIRKDKTIKVNLTKKMIPTFAARESLAKEPPYPKSKKYVPEKNYLGQEIDEKNPIWAKQRGDNFYNNKDYRSAINAYNTALDLDPNFHKVLINRGTSYMCLGEFDLALNDFNKAIDLINAIDKKERSDAFYDRINVKALSKIYAVYALRQEYQKALDIINEKLLLKEHAFPFIIPEDKWKKIEKDKVLIESRMKNEKLKENGDKLLVQKKFEEAEKIYKEILDIEPENERVLSNLSMIYLFQGKHDEVISICTKILGIFQKFKEKIKIKNMNNLFEIKVLLRRAKCYEIKNEMYKAQKDVESIEKLSISNQNVLKEVKEVKDKLKIHVVDSYKQSANEHLSKQEFSEALDYYNKAIDVVKFSNIYNKIDLVKILLNRTACLIKLTQYDNTFLEFERILSILSKQKAIADIQSNIILSEEVKDLEFKTLVKRAYVYTINNKYEEAIKDYNRALELKPGDIKIKENLAKLKALEK
jgi:dyslexia susceptibility 1 candidate gene 1 protein